MIRASWIERFGPVAASVLSVVVVFVSMSWGSKAVGGADQYGYVSEAGLLRQGHLVVHEDVVRESPWPGAQGTWTPIGYRELPHERDAITPVYAPGLPLLMVVLQGLFGFCGAFFVTPLCAGATIFVTYLLGRLLFEQSDTALWGAMLLASSPIFIYQAMLPMSDVPVTTAWTVAILFALAEHPLAAGLAAAAAIAVRPNLAPVAVALLVWAVLRDVKTRRSDGRLGSATIRVVIGLAPAVIAIAWLNAALYGSPFVSGYGQLEDLYAVRHFWTNVAHFSIWIVETDTPIVALAVVCFVAPRLLPPLRVPFARVLIGVFTAAIVGAYLFYLPFDAWWFLRFLLPAWPIVMLLTAAALGAIASRWLASTRRVTVTAIVLLLAGHGVAVAANRGAFTLWRGESRYIDVARFIETTTDPRAVFISWQHTAAIRFYADRLTLHFARLDRRWLDRAVAHLQAAGRRPYIVLDEYEVEPFRQRFRADNRLGALDWPPFAMFEQPTVLIYDATGAPPGGTSSQQSAVGSGTITIPSSGGRSARACVPPIAWPPRVRLP